MVNNSGSEKNKIRSKNHEELKSRAEEIKKKRGLSIENESTATPVKRFKPKN